MNVDKPHTFLRDFEIADIDAKTTQVVRNVEVINDSCIILICEDGKLEYYNSRATELFELDAGLRSSEDLGIIDLLQHLAQRGDFGPGDPDQFIEMAKNLIQQSGSEDGSFGQTYLTMPSGNILRARLCRNTDGTITLSAYDVSDQKRNENMLEMALSIGLAGYLIVDTQSQKTRVMSRYVSNMFTSDEMQTIETSGLSSLFHPDDLARSEEMWKNVTKTGETERGTLRVITQKEGLRWLNFVLTPESTAPNYNPILVFFNDVTDNLRQQENLRQAKILAEDSLSSKQTFLASLSHEIRTPMNAVIGMTDALIHHHADPKIAPELDLIQKSASSILKMLDETLTHSRLDTDSYILDPMPASPTEVVRHVCAIWEQQAHKNNNKIRCIIKDTVPDTVLFDKFRYEQCVNNLLSNAVKFTQDGTIDVVLTVVTKQVNPQLVLAIKDTGIGMTAAQQETVFEAYTQADKSISSRYGGTGLGMNITKQIVERMEGSISIRSELGSGSMFVMSVPLITVEDENTVETAVTLERQLLTKQVPDMAKIEAPSPICDLVQAAAPVASQAEPADAIQITREGEPATSQSLIDEMLVQAEPEVTAYSALRILVVDDNPTNHLVVKSLLKSVVADITLASNGQEALEILDTTPIDIVLMDIHMPIMDGIECTLAIRSCDKPWRDVIIIALTADPQYQQIKLCKNIGMDEALAKPVRLNDLLGAIDQVLSAANSIDDENMVVA